MNVLTDEERLGNHVGQWFSAKQVRLEFRIYDDDNDLVAPKRLEEDMYLESSGLSFRILLHDFTRDRYFIEIVS